MVVFFLVDAATVVLLLPLPLKPVRRSVRVLLLFGDPVASVVATAGSLAFPVVTGVPIVRVLVWAVAVAFGFALVLAMF